MAAFAQHGEGFAGRLLVGGSQVCGGSVCGLGLLGVFLAIAAAHWHAQRHVFVGERGAPLRRSTFGRTYRKARAKVGLPDTFRFYDLRHTGNTLAADTGAKLKDLMTRAGQSSERTQLIYQHSTKRHQKKIAESMNLDVHVSGRKRPSAGRQQAVA